MPLVHHLSGTAFEPRDGPSARLRAGRPETGVPQHPALPAAEPAVDAVEAAPCRLCVAQAPVFDLTMRCCLDRYESLFGSVHEHRSMFALAREAALDGDFVPARRLVESYRRVFGPMAAVALKRMLWHSIAEAQLRPHPDVAVESPRTPIPRSV